LRNKVPVAQRVQAAQVRSDLRVRPAKRVRLDLDLPVTPVRSAPRVTQVLPVLRVLPVRADTPALRVQPD
jgi:hypothetical protein